MNRPAAMVAALYVVGCGGGMSVATAPDAGGPTLQAPTVPEPCQGIPTTGSCASATLVRYCVVPTGAGSPFLGETACAAGETCQLSEGRAECVSTSLCTEGALECSGDALRTCASGAWTSTPCPYGCTVGALGPFCAPGASTEVFSGTLSYEKRVPNAWKSDWSTKPLTVGAPGFLVISRYPDASQPGGYAILDTAITSRSTLGAFSVKVRPAAQRTTDELVFTAAGSNASGGFAYVVADPQVGKGERTAGSPPRDPKVWMWSAPLASLSSRSVVITLADGAGAAHVFAQVQAVRERTASLLGKPGLSLVVWLGLGTNWDCGACFAQFGTSAFDQSFASQIWFGADTTDQAYWADAVTTHELGHWVMASYGTPPGEGGAHYIGTPTFPGQAWSEGWATFFGSYHRGDPVYLDKQDGTMFWFSLEARKYPGGITWQRPTPSGGLLQKMDENELAAILWAASSKGAASTPLLHGIGAARMNTAPYARGYTRHTWDLGNSGDFVKVVDTGQSVPALPDFLDALLCANFSKTALDAALVPSSYYPYPSSTPLCR